METSHSFATELDEAVCPLYRRQAERVFDRIKIQEWIRVGATYRSVAEASSIGLVGNKRFSERARRQYLKLWDWSAHHLSSRAQDRMFKWSGFEGLDRRIARCNRIIKALLEQR